MTRIDKRAFGELIKYLRMRDNVLQEDLASVLFVTPGTVSKWETGVNYPNIETLFLISQYFNISLDELVQAEATLQKLKTPNTIPADTPPKTKFINNKLIIALASIFILISTPLIIFFLWRNSSPTIYEVAERVSYDENWGKSYDIALLYNGKLTIDSMEKMTEGYRYLISSRFSNTPDIAVYRLFYYNNENEAVIWGFTDTIGYIFNYMEGQSNELH